MSATGETKRRRLAPAARRELIDDAATRVFAERGYEAATMGEIASEAGVVASVLYDHYPSKRELYVKLLEERGRELIESTIRPSPGADPEGALRRQVADFLAAIERDPFVWRMLFREPPADPEIAAAQAGVQAQATQAIAKALAGPGENAAGGRDVASLRTLLLAEMAKSSLNGLAAWWWEHRGANREELAATATALLWGGLRGIMER